ncbi:MAG TPA: hypothetical protein VKU40_05595, partial [Thermoanaerobaculia bacterium]|nr:hypothetical protein [Thermoanaerobaculia bacterium]
EGFNARLALSEELSGDPQSGLPLLATVARRSTLANVGSLYRYDGAQWLRGSIEVPVGSGARLAYGDDLALEADRASQRAMLFDPYRRQWGPAPVAGSDAAVIAPTVAGDYFTVGRDVFRLGNDGEPVSLGALDPNMNPDSLANRAPRFLAYETQAGNTVVVPLHNGELQFAAAIELPNQRIHVGEQDLPGSILVGADSLVTYSGDFRKPSALRLYKYIDGTVEGEILTFPVTRVTTDVGLDEIGGDGDGKRHVTSFAYDFASTTLTSDGSVTRFGAAATLAGYDAAGWKGAWPPPDDTPFGRTDYRYHNERDAGAAGLEPAMAPAVDLFDYVQGRLIDKTDVDASGAVQMREAYQYAVATTRTSPAEPTTEVALYGAYVETAAVDTTYYEPLLPDGVDATAAAALTAGEVPAALAAALAGYGVRFTAEARVETFGHGRWRIHPDPAQPLWVPLDLAADGSARSAVPVVRRIDYEHSPATGQQLVERTSFFDSDGVEKQQVSSTYYGWMVDDYAAALDALHLWAPVVTRVVVETAADGSDAQPATLEVRTLADWGDAATPRWALRRSFSARSADAYDPSRTVPVRFDDWDNQGLPSNDLWTLQGEVLERSPNGAVAAALDVSGVVTSFVLDSSGVYVVAQAVGAGAEQATYAGFEPYESGDGWAFADGTPLADHTVDGDAHSGVASVRVAPGEQMRRRLDLGGVTGPSFVSYWLKTEAGFDTAGGEAGVRLETPEGRIVWSSTTAGTDSEWSYRSAAADLAQADRGPLDLVAWNGKSGEDAAMLLDDLFFQPVEQVQLAANVYDGYRMRTASVGADGGTRRTLFDAFQRPSVTTEADGVVVSAQTAYLARQSADEGSAWSFPVTQPNAVLTASAAGGGVVADLFDGDGWRRQWSGDLAAFAAEDGAL